LLFIDRIDILALTEKIIEYEYIERERRSNDHAVDYTWSRT